MNRNLKPNEHLILQALSAGNSNLSISNRTNLPLKTVENSISRSLIVFGISQNENVNVRVLLAIAYRANFQNIEYDSVEIAPVIQKRTLVTNNLASPIFCTL